MRRQLPDFIIGTRFSLYEGITGGCGTAAPDRIEEDLSEMLGIIGMTIRAGANFINVSAGIPSQTPNITRPIKKLDQGLFNHFRYTETVKKNYPSTVVIGSAYSTGMEKSVELAAENITAGRSDMIGYGRLNLSEPLLPKRLLESDPAIRWCKLCSGCSKLLKEQQNVRCVVYNK